VGAVPVAYSSSFWNGTSIH